MIQEFRSTEQSEAWGSRQPFEFGEELATRVEELDLLAALAELRDEGFAIVPEIASPEFTTRLRETCIRLAQETAGPAKGYSAALLLGRDPIFQEVVLNPKVLALVEAMCGKGALLSQLIASVRPKGAPAIDLHADQNWTPAPFPEHNQLLTMCWAMEDFSETGGCTKVIPKSHQHRRHPNATEMKEQAGAIPTECRSGSLVCWNGSIWHGNYPRSAEGNRVVLHITFGRLALRTVENYDHLDETWLAGKPTELRVMLGREDFLGSTTIERGSADYSRIPKSFAWARS
jgi:hypothetical protein